MSTETNEESWQSPRGEVRISSPAPRITVYRLHGYIETDSVPAFLRAVERFTRAGLRTVSFVDSADVTGYDSEVRTRVVEASQKYRGMITTHVLVRSKIVSMGISVAGMMTGTKMISYADRSKFEAALREALRGAERTSSPTG